ncbi:DgyrCDS5827 [Dimorphilus gyrociliatus]|uniref:DgyrCDS5827 n=1 Tax=Dimorphilus gyrociliatus TaxID=2664684 RepID=A0A7I8VQY1_9ANNE|nr:DgyrCDS5827 [Dimorphilus gyrociliatus]
MSVFEIPEGLTDLLQNFTVQVLRERPGDLLQFAADYFNVQLVNRDGSAINTRFHDGMESYQASQLDEDIDSEEEFYSVVDNSFGQS